MQQDLKETLARKVSKNILGGAYPGLIVRVIQFYTITDRPGRLEFSVILKCELPIMRI